jgi:hypothetical protein
VCRGKLKSIHDAYSSSAALRPEAKEISRKGASVQHLEIVLGHADSNPEFVIYSAYTGDTQHQIRLAGGLVRLSFGGQAAQVPRLNQTREL